MIGGTVTRSRKSITGQFEEFLETLIGELEIVQERVYATLQEVVGTRHYSLSALKGMGHPYKVGGYPPMNPGIINRQSGDFFGSFHVNRPYSDGTSIYLTLTTEETEIHGYLREGTSKMIPRPYEALIAQRVYSQYGNRIRRMVEETMQVFFERA